MHLQAVFLSVPIVMFAASGVTGPHLFLSFQALQQLDTLSENKIESQENARAYVRNAAAIFGVASSSLLPEDLEYRLAAAELNAAKNPNKLVSDDQVAEAFNFLSDEFRVANPEQLTGADILLYRGVKASMFPHLNNPKNVNGSRPLGALIMLDTLVFEGGIMEGVRRAALLDRPPGSLKITDGRIVGHLGVNRNPNLTGRKYQTASLTYFARLSPQGAQSFFDRLARILALP
jgi:hypothetical protein